MRLRICSFATEMWKNRISEVFIFFNSSSESVSSGTTSAVQHFLSNDKMSNDKMSKDKMSKDKMSKDKMSKDKMSKDKM
jgi:pentapeptide MXKDX repeat protein